MITEEQAKEQAAQAGAGPAGAEPPLVSEHAYDGIQEYDNPLPGWWVWTFVVTIVFSALYLPYYHLGEGQLVADEYAQDLALHQELEAKRALESGEVSEEVLAALAADAGTVAKGAALFQTNCALCHGAGGEGKIGPNLTDGYWLHGGSRVDIHRVIEKGVPEKGMVPWGPQLGPDAVKQLAAYVAAELVGKDRPGPLGPQGDPVGGPAAGVERPGQ